MGLQHWPLTLLDFFESDNDGLYALFMFVAIGLAITIIVMVMNVSRKADQARHAMSAADMLNEVAVDTPEIATPTDPPL
jgi:hypothetical protein